MNQTLSYILNSPFSLFHIVFLALLGYWIYHDATGRASNAGLLWAIGCTVFQPLVVGYLLYRSQIGGRIEPAGIKERIVGTFVISHLVTTQLWFVLRLTDLIATLVYPPIVELQYYVTLFAVGLPPGYWLVWRRGWARIRRKIGWVQESERSGVLN